MRHTFMEILGAKCFYVLVILNITLVLLVTKLRTCSIKVKTGASAQSIKSRLESGPKSIVFLATNCPFKKSLCVFLLCFLLLGFFFCCFFSCSNEETLTFPQSLVRNLIIFPLEQFLVLL